MLRAISFYEVMNLYLSYKIFSAFSVTSVVFSFIRQQSAAETAHSKTAFGFNPTSPLI